MNRQTHAVVLLNLDEADIDFQSSPRSTLSKTGEWTVSISLSLDIQLGAGFDSHTIKKSGDDKSCKEQNVPI